MTSTEQAKANAPGFQAVEPVDTGVSRKAIAVTQAAVEAMRRQLEKRDTPNAAIRVGVRGGGCSGFSYAIEFDDTEPRKGDLVLEFPEEGKSTVRVFCDKKSILY